MHSDLPWLTPELSEYSREGLRRHHELLLSNRMRLVEHLLPATVRTLGERFRPLFLTYGEEHWPPAHENVLSDALHFAAWLEQTGLPVNISCVDRREVNRLRFLARSDRKIQFHLLSADIQLLWKSRTGLRELRLALPFTKLT